MALIFSIILGSLANQLYDTIVKGIDRLTRQSKLDELLSDLRWKRLYEQAGLGDLVEKYRAEGSQDALAKVGEALEKALQDEEFGSLQSEVEAILNSREGLKDIIGLSQFEPLSSISDETISRVIASKLLREVDMRYMKDGDAWSALRYMVEHLDEAIAACWGTLYRYDTTEDTFVRVAFSTIGGKPPEKINAGHLSTVLEGRTALYVADALNSSEHQNYLRGDFPDELKVYIHTIGSQYSVPLIVVDRFYGVFSFYKSGLDSFSLTDMQAANDLGARASLLLENHEILEARRKLYDASLRLQTQLRPDELMRVAVTSIVEIGYDRARLYMISLDGRRLESVVQVGFEERENIRRFENREIFSELGEYPPAIRTDEPHSIVEDGILPHVLELGKPVLYVTRGSDSKQTIGRRDTRGIQVYIKEKDDQYRDELEREDVNEWLDFPLIAAGEKLGKISVDNKRSKRPFSRIDCDILGLFGQYLAQAIRSAYEIERTAGFGYGARTLAHNIRSRASSIDITLDIIQKQSLSEPLGKYVQMIRRANDGILGHVNVMRRIADLEETDLKRFTIRELTVPIWDELRDAFDTVKMAFKADIPKEVFNKAVEVDLDQMIEVFLNLMRNSREATEDEGKVFLSARLESDHVYVTWQDDGPGIPEKDIKNLFRIGFTTKKGGTGTGLYSVKRMLLKNRGDVWFEKSEKNEKGNYIARFVMKIPLLGNGLDERDADPFDKGGLRE